MAREIFTDEEEGDQSKVFHNEASRFKPNLSDCKAEFKVTVIQTVLKMGNEIGRKTYASLVNWSHSRSRRGKVRPFVKVQ